MHQAVAAGRPPPDTPPHGRERRTLWVASHHRRSNTHTFLLPLHCCFCHHALQPGFQPAFVRKLALKFLVLSFELLLQSALVLLVDGRRLLQDLNLGEQAVPVSVGTEPARVAEN